MLVAGRIVGISARQMEVTKETFGTAAGGVGGNSLDTVLLRRYLGTMRRAEKAASKRGSEMVRTARSGSAKTLTSLVCVR